jgi:hypothetical protein
VRAPRAAFIWLVDVRYLTGNPWKAVNDPRVVQRQTTMQIQRALPADLWRRLRHELDRRCSEGAARHAARSWVCSGAGSVKLTGEAFLEYGTMT